MMRRLHAECPWKRAQTHRSLARYLLEESHETLEAIDSGDSDHLREELGDLLLQVFLHAAIAEKAGTFTLDDVASEVTEKMRRRNPHVFGDTPAQDLAAAEAVYEQAKSAEKRRTSPEEGIPPTLPALLYADKVLGRLPSTGPDDIPRGSGIGDRLLGLVAEARAEGVDPEQELRDAVRRLLEERASGSSSRRGGQW